MTVYTLLIEPFTDYAFMRRALSAAIILSMSGAPIGVFLLLRRMTLMGDTLTHAILPGVAGAYMFFGLSLWPMTLFGLLTGVLVASSAGVIAKLTSLKEDASFTGMYLTALAAGVLMVSLRGSPVDLMHVLFGNVLAVDNASLLLMAGASGTTIVVMLFFLRGFTLECFDPVHLESTGSSSSFYYHTFLMLIVLNVVVAFQVLGTLMALGLMILPAIAARFWTYHIDRMIGLAMFYAIFSAFTGLLLSYHADVPSGPSMVLTASALYFLSLLLGTHKGLLWRILPIRQK
ncbi:MAG: metal ABC transporter permease [Rickettsiales bacterium]